MLVLGELVTPSLTRCATRRILGELLDLGSGEVTGRLQTLAGIFEKDGASFNLGVVPKIGTTLVRQWRGHTHTVLVHQDGFEHEGQRYRSLTAIAKRIPEAHWSGPRFFGLTKRVRTLADAKTGR